MDRNVLEKKQLDELREIASTMELEGYQKMKKADLIDLIVGEAPSGNDNGKASGDDEDGPERVRTRTREVSGEDGDSDEDDADDDESDNNDGDNRNRKRRNRRKGGGGGGGGGDQDDDLEVREGVLDLLPEGYGFLRTTGYLAGDLDVYVSQSMVRRHNLRRGDLVRGPIRHNKGNDKFPALVRVDAVEDEEPIEGKRANFKDLTPYFPRSRFHLEKSDGSPIAMRIVDMIAPIGKGQRGLIVSPPKAGKTTILKQLAQAIEANSPDTHLMVLLVDERPEEVTDFERSTGGEVISSTFDRPADDHTQVAELTIERAKRLVEGGRDVVILLDSITRLARAYNLAAPASGRILSGGVDSAALYPPKRFFGAARNIEEGGSLTIIATALIETGSKMDEVIFEEFKGTGNMELRLSRQLEQKRIFPAVDIEASGTRKEELLLTEEELNAVWKLRRVLHSMDGGASLELLIDKLKATKSNEQFLQLIQKSNLG
ncbi:MAG: transcription termination factor Rho [Actinobacteria bacterium]|nr:transcription termination factor Rho [Actinomycetota bacterium]